jgi:(1->4)-alpha-D-glucan 1-alpha-D-glucosylmutase
LRGILASLSSLPPMSQTDSDAIETRRREKAGARARLATLTRRSSAVAAHIARVVEEFNGRPGEPRSFDQLHALLEVQAYRLSYWRTAFDEINYRRFFDINELAALRMEDPQVFAATHGLLLQLLEEGLVTGIRVDHPDGLYDPEAYFCALRQAAQRALADGGSTSPTYIVVEKILAAGERLRDSWPVNGTTGYNFLNVLNGVFVHPAGLSALRRTYRGFARHRETTADTAYASKWLVMRSAMASELNVLSRALNRLSELDRRSRDFTLNGLRRALTEIVACFPVYRTYVTARGASDDDLTAIATAVEAARRRNPAEEPSIFEFIRGHLAPQAEDEDGSGLREHSLAFAQRLQQYSAPVVAKGVEDTAFYRDVLLLSANEVGGDLRARARAVADLHADNVHRATRWPLEMTAASTHDTKRGEDARARINVISELAGEWRTMVKRWAALNALARQRIGGLIAPDRNDEWLFYQSLIGAWPAELVDAPLPAAAPSELIERMLAFMRKATKEAKRHTSWLHENEAYERAVTTFVRAVLGGDTAAVFLESFVPFGRRIAWFGMINSLSQLALRLASPGVPDIYQGSELWNFSLVDPDNRRPVDFSERRRALAAIESLLAQADRHDERPLTLGPMLEQWPDGRVKLYTLVRALRLRRQHRDLFIRGSYEPFGATADHPHVIAFSRRHATDEIIVVAPRFVATLLRGEVRAPLGEAAWGDRGVRLPERLKRARFVNLFTREVVAPAIVENEPRLLLNSALQTWPVGWFRVGR